MYTVQLCKALVSGGDKMKDSITEKLSQETAAAFRELSPQLQVLVEQIEQEAIKAAALSPKKKRAGAARGSGSGRPRKQSTLPSSAPAISSTNSSDSDFSGSADGIPTSSPRSALERVKIEDAPRRKSTGDASDILPSSQSSPAMSPLTKTKHASKTMSCSDPSPLISERAATLPLVDATQ
jgi:hypothetical protein